MKCVQLPLLVIVSACASALHAQGFHTRRYADDSLTGFLSRTDADPLVLRQDPRTFAQVQDGDRLTIRGQDGGGDVDASDPTQVTFHIMTEFEWEKLNNGNGDMVAFKLSPFIPIEVADQRFLFNLEIPLPQYAGLTGLSHETGVGDTRLKFFWLIPTQREFVRAVVPSFDAIAPTGDSGRGLGGGQWILMPNMVFALQPAKNWDMYPFFRYVLADGVRPELVPDLPLPEDPAGLFGATDIRGFNLEWINVFKLEEAFFDWVEVTPDYFVNGAGDRGETFTMKYTIAKACSESFFVMFDFWHPVAGNVNSDFTAKIRLDWYPPSGGLFKTCRRHRR